MIHFSVTDFCKNLWPLRKMTSVMDVVLLVGWILCNRPSPLPLKGTACSFHSKVGAGQGWHEWVSLRTSRALSNSTDNYMAWQTHFEQIMRTLIESKNNGSIFIPFSSCFTFGIPSSQRFANCSNLQCQVICAERFHKCFHFCVPTKQFYFTKPLSSHWEGKGPTESASRGGPSRQRRRLTWNVPPGGAQWCTRCPGCHPRTVQIQLPASGRVSGWEVCCVYIFFS